MNITPHSSLFLFLGVLSGVKRIDYGTVEVDLSSCPTTSSYTWGFPCLHCGLLSTLLHRGPVHPVPCRSSRTRLGMACKLLTGVSPDPLVIRRKSAKERANQHIWK